MLKTVFNTLVLLTLPLLLSACSDNDKNTANPESGDKTAITIGTTAGDFGDMVKEFVQPELAKQGYTITLTEFTDYVQPNRALADGSIDINIFQHKPYLDAFKTANNLDLVEVFQVPTGPLAVYSGSRKTLEDLTGPIKISVPNDPSNFARTLVMLDEMQWIKLKANINPLTASKRDIAEYLYEVTLVELEAAQLPRSRDDVDFAIIPGNYAASSGIKFSEGLYKEGGFTFINWAAIKRNDLGKKWVQDIKALYESDDFKRYAENRFEGYKYPENW